MTISRKWITSLTAAVLAAGTLTAASSATAATGPAAQSSCYLAQSTAYPGFEGNNLHCAPRAGAAAYYEPDGNEHWSNVMGTFSGSQREFFCWTEGATHSGGNSVWYKSWADEPSVGHGFSIGYVKSTDVYTGTHPYPGLRHC
ncbi:hypothetical protein ACH429_03250 [Streptomyces pathocidini]|uniref:Secreted protein n=1 Tax=Streptomyces pathocidini TaxID=1650571 RepID=A0ABW7UP90_9ACTN|nr:hypothetical protein [Streptomyces pathocidini]